MWFLEKVGGGGDFSLLGRRSWRAGQRRLSIPASPPPSWGAPQGSLSPLALFEQQYRGYLGSSMSCARAYEQRPSVLVWPVRPHNLRALLSLLSSPPMCPSTRTLWALSLQAGVSTTCSILTSLSSSAAIWGVLLDPLQVMGLHVGRVTVLIAIPELKEGKQQAGRTHHTSGGPWGLGIPDDSGACLQPVAGPTPCALKELP